MSTMTMSGREAPSTTKRIDVEANLLQDWIAERRHIRKQIQLRLVGVLGLLFLGVYGSNMLISVRSVYAAKSKPLQMRLNALNKQVAALAPAESGGTAPAEVQKMLDTSRLYGNAFVGQMLFLMNSASRSMALSSLKADVLGGEVKLTGQADAETYFAANEFIQTNNDSGKNANAVLVSTSRSDVLAEDGVSFQFVKKVRVAQ